MNSIHGFIVAIACLVSIVTSLPGLFLVLYDSALMSDAISHAILPGIALMFLWVGNLDSPLLLLGAASAGILTVISTQLLIQTNRIKKDAAIGLIFPLFFSIGVIIITLFARNVHLDVDMVLLGELAFAPFNRLFVAGRDIGPSALWITGVELIVVATLIYALYKELVIATFDRDYAKILFFRPQGIYYFLMAITSIVAVAAFDNVGSIVTVALMITPAATAFIMVRELHHILYLTIIIAISSAIIGYSIAALGDVSIAGAIALSNGIIFMVAFIGGRKGLIAYYRTHARAREHCAMQIVASVIAQQPHCVSSLAKTLNWDAEYVKKVIHRGVQQKLWLKNNESFITLR